VPRPGRPGTITVPMTSETISSCRPRKPWRPNTSCRIAAAAPSQAPIVIRPPQSFVTVHLLFPVRRCLPGAACPQPWLPRRHTAPGSRLVGTGKDEVREDHAWSCPCAVAAR
jgi:hypothetical protein